MVTTRAQRRALEEATEAVSADSAAWRAGTLNDLPGSFQRPPEPATKRSKRLASGALDPNKVEREPAYYSRRFLLETEQGR